jgi:hypothetical protein
MTHWSGDELRHFGDAQEVRVAGLRPDRSLRSPVIVWIVRVGDDLYTRSVNGPGAAWFRGVQARHRGQLSACGVVADVDFVVSADADDALDREYARKYAHNPGPVESITSRTARSTTLKLIPHQDD